MAQLLVRNLDDDLVRDLKRRAGEHGVSVEEEHRRILRDALRPESAGKMPSFWEVLTDMPDAGDDSIFERDRSAAGRNAAQGFLTD
jgi:antitoxin FitA